MNGDIKGLAEYLKKKNSEHVKKIQDEQKKFIELSKDPMNPEYQRMLEERIHQQNIDKNYEYAQEYIPEVFGHINMLYINASINKVPIQAFVDSGAQSTIMSQSLAERCGYFCIITKVDEASGQESSRNCSGGRYMQNIGANPRCRNRNREAVHNLRLHRNRE